MVIVVTGANSFIGSAVTRRLRENGHTVYGLRHSIEEAPERNEIIPEKADIWVHFAWAGAGRDLRNNEDMQRRSVEIAENAAQCANKLNCKRFIFAGSQAEIHGTSLYGIYKKKAAERIGEIFKGDLVHMRIFSVYGPGDHEGTLIEQIKEACRNDSELILGPCTQKWNFTFISDCAGAFLTVCEAKDTINDTIDTGTDDIRELRSFVTEAYGELGGRRELRFGERGNNAEGAVDLIPDYKKLYSLGFRPEVSFREGIKQ
ncbi:MAG: NAD(P)-dependent oxidoreductase [Eubacteriales bacterium]|nr:NAD(P)-dependent oxidoreductase [Eubacteriales bacterium]